ncbi:hypothetical protein MMC18_005030 [Xylographa bjoerkii]|nr:hypothetical protein [Xylographa bjoerkii]
MAMLCKYCANRRKTILRSKRATKAEKDQALIDYQKHKRAREAQSAAAAAAAPSASASTEVSTWSMDQDLQSVDWILSPGA